MIKQTGVWLSNNVTRIWGWLASFADDEAVGGVVSIGDSQWTEVLSGLGELF